MADLKLTQLTEDTAPTSDDITYTVTDPAGTPLSRKATLANLRKGTHPGSTTTTDNAVARYNGTAGDIQNSGVIIDDSNNITGIGTITSPTLITPALGTPASGTLTNCTGLPAAGVVGGALVSGGALGTPASGVLTNCTGSPALTAPALGAATGTSLAVTGLLKSSGTAGVGYATGAGGTVTQATSKTTAVTINKLCGRITMSGNNMTANEEVQFLVNNTTSADGDTVIINYYGGGTYGAYFIQAGQVTTNAFTISVRNVSAGTLGEAISMGFSIIKAVLT